MVSGGRATEPVCIEYRDPKVPVGLSPTKSLEPEVPAPLQPQNRTADR